MIRLPVVRGIMERRILTNFRINPDVLSNILPKPFKPKTVKGYAIGGICMIRLRGIRPRFVPFLFGISSENAAHRFAVTWNENGTEREGVYIPRRDSSSRINSILGGRVFPGLHSHGRFDIEEKGNFYSVTLNSDDGATHVSVSGTVASQLPSGSVFKDLAESSEFFERGSLGYSVTGKPGVFDGLELRTSNWTVEPLDVTHVESSFFSDRNIFPEGSTEFDCALLMRNIDHEWHGHEDLRGEVP